MKEIIKKFDESEAKEKESMKEEIKKFEEREAKKREEFKRQLKEGKGTFDGKEPFIYRTKYDND